MQCASNGLHIRPRNSSRLHKDVAVVVNVLDLYSEDLSSSPTKAYWYFCKNVS